MRDCPNAEIRDLLPDLLHARLTEGEVATVRAHLEACEDCSAELGLLGGLRTATSKAPAVDLDRIVAALPPAPTRGAEVRVLTLVPRRRWSAWGAAGGGLLAAGVAAAMFLSPELLSPPASPAPSVAATSEVLPGTASPAPTPNAPAARAPEPAATVPVAAGPRARPAGRELALGADLADIGDAGLEALTTQLEALDALPALEPDEVETGGGEGGRR